ncbi:hypothetical protein B5E53_16145 [Eubacterium sp. An11]|uniref:fibronectin type III domain-containing protein n=1 Tax=Eubacterium sp. An11 TaxID=1965542 RepID=UPI000B39B3DF|nr:fibronectin type III domain-containing protein [Eubacterium sp. An11]OUQ63326.1 hypothetical protein B5E53_16145 [Eubacterium sp. An11]
MRKYLFPVLGVLFLAVLAPMSVDAKKADDTKVDLYYYQPPEYDVNLSAADMNSAQAVGVGTSVNVDFRVNDYKVFKLAIPANQIVRVDWAKSGNNQGNPSCIYYDASGKRVDYETAFGSEKAETYYMLAYSNSPVVSSFTVKSMMFSDNVTQKTSDGTTFGFVPTVTGTYSFNVKDSDYKNVSMYISGEYKDYKTTEGKYTYTVSATLTAGKFYKLQVYSHGKYTLTLTKSAAADAVANQIAAIGAATTSNGSTIDAARAAFNALSSAEQKVVSNASTLTALESQYANLTKPSVAKVKIKKVKAAKKGKKATVTWKRVSGAAGYQVTYSLKKKFKNAKTITVSASKAKTVLKKLKKNKKYYVKVRAFKTYRGQTYYGNYSKVKKVTIK